MAKEAKNFPLCQVSEDDLIKELIRRSNNGDIIITTEDLTDRESIIMFQSAGSTSGHFINVTEVEND